MTAYVLTVLALITLGIAVKQRWLSDADHVASHETESLAVAPAGAKAIAESSLSTDAQLHQSNTAPIQSSTSLPAKNAPSRSDVTNHPTVMSQQRDGSEAQASIAFADIDPNEVIGRPFPMSASVANPCKQDLAKRSEATCGEVFQLLSEMADQPRDIAWATEMEAKLRNLVLAEPNKFKVRAIECRTSLCVIEVASTYGPFLGIGYDDPLYKRLDNWIGMTGHESDPSGARVTVSLLTFKRR